MLEDDSCDHDIKTVPEKFKAKVKGQRLHAGDRFCVKCGYVATKEKRETCKISQANKIALTFAALLGLLITVYFLLHMANPSNPLKPFKSIGEQALNAYEYNSRCWEQDGYRYCPSSCESVKEDEKTLLKCKCLIITEHTSLFTQGDSEIICGEQK